MLLFLRLLILEVPTQFEWERQRTKEKVSCISYVPITLGSSMSIVFFTGHMQPFGHIYEIASTCELRVAVICSTHEPQMDVVYLVLVSHDGSPWDEEKYLPTNWSHTNQLINGGKYFSSSHGNPSWGMVLVAEKIIFWVVVSNIVLCSPLIWGRFPF